MLGLWALWRLTCRHERRLTECAHHLPKLQPLHRLAPKRAELRPAAQRAAKRAAAAARAAQAAVRRRGRLVEGRQPAVSVRTAAAGTAVVAARRAHRHAHLAGGRRGPAQRVRKRRLRLPHAGRLAGKREEHARERVAAGEQPPACPADAGAGRRRWESERTPGGRAWQAPQRRRHAVGQASPQVPPGTA